MAGCVGAARAGQVRERTPAEAVVVALCQALPSGGDSLGNASGSCPAVVRTARETAKWPRFEGIEWRRALENALAAMAAEQAGPRGQTVLLRSTVDEQAFCTAHQSQTVYHGPVVYADDPIRRLEGALPDLELLLLVFRKHAAFRAQREYRFVVWAEEEPDEDRVDLRISPALLDAMQRSLQEPAAGGLVSAGMEESSAVEAVVEGSRPNERVEVLSVPAGPENPTVAPRRYEFDRLLGDRRERTTAYAALDALREGVGKSDAAWHAEPIVRFLCSAFGDGLAGVRVSDDNLIVITAEFQGDDPVEASIAVGPEGYCACRISAGDTHLLSTATDVRSFERMLKSRLAEIGVHGSDDTAGG